MTYITPQEWDEEPVSDKEFDRFTKKQEVYYYFNKGLLSKEEKNKKLKEI